MADKKSKNEIPMDYYQLDPAHTDPVRVKKEREEARRLKKSAWWHQKIQNGICEYCQKQFEAKKLTMDHRVPIARGGKSTKGNIVACCEACNQAKKLKTPVELLIEKKK